MQEHQLRSLVILGRIPGPRAFEDDDDVVGWVPKPVLLQDNTA
jgi:hypothetical protein